MITKNKKSNKKNKFLNWIIKLKIQDSIGLLALLIAVLSFWYSCNKDSKQDIRLEESEQGRITLKQLRFFVYREITKIQLDTINWGYPVEVAANSADYILNMDKLSVQNYLIGVNTSTGDTINDPSIISISELQEKANKIKTSTPIHIFAYKRYRVMIELQNTGLKDCKLTSLNIFLKNPNSSTFNNPIDLATNQVSIDPGETKISFFHFDLGLAQKLQNPFEVKLEIFYINQKGKTIKKNELYIYDKFGWRNIDEI